MGHSAPTASLDCGHHRYLHCCHCRNYPDHAEYFHDLGAFFGNAALRQVKWDEHIGSEHVRGRTDILGPRGHSESFPIYSDPARQREQ